MKYQKLKKEEEPRRWKSQGVERNLDKKLKKTKNVSQILKKQLKIRFFSCICTGQVQIFFQEHENMQLNSFSNTKTRCYAKKTCMFVVTRSFLLNTNSKLFFARIYKKLSKTFIKTFMCL